MPEPGSQLTVSHEQTAAETKRVQMTNPIKVAPETDLAPKTAAIDPGKDFYDAAGRRWECLGKPKESRYRSGQVHGRASKQRTGAGSANRA